MKKSFVKFNALITVIFLAAGLISCTSSSNTGTASFAGIATNEGYAASITVNFYPNGTYESYMYGTQDSRGTYKLNGDFETGTVSLTQTEEIHHSKWQKCMQKIHCTISDGMLSNQYGNFKRLYSK